MAGASWKFWAAAALIAAAGVPFATPVTGQQPDETVVIRGGWVFDPEAGTFTRNEGITVRAGKFLLAGGAPPERYAAGARTIDLTDEQYILPGMFDLHAHYNVNLDRSGRRDETVVNPIVFLANGVTSTFPAGEYDPERMMEARKRIDRGEQVGARIFNSGPYFGTAREGWNRNATAADIHRDVDYWAEQGVAGFKAKGISPEHLKPLVERAHQHGLTVTGHVDSGFRNSVNARDAIRTGIDRIEHIHGGDWLHADVGAYQRWIQVDTASQEFRDIVRLFIDHGVYFDATITAPVYFTELKEGFEYWIDERDFFTPEVQAVVRAREPRDYSPLMDSLYWAMRRTTKAFYDNGGGHLLTLGTDLPSSGDFLPGFAAHRELHTMVLAGIPPAAALRAATINGARALNVGDRLGSIETGKWADLFVVRGNPLDDITNTHDVELVMKAGVVYDPKELLASVKGKLAQPTATTDGLDEDGDIGAQDVTGTLVVTNKSAATASFIDVASGRILGTVPTGQGPHEIALTADGSMAVVTDYGGGGAGGSSLTVIDVPARRVARTIDLGEYTRPHGIAFLPGDSLVAVTSEASRNVVIVHPGSGQVRRAIPTGHPGSHMLTFGADARYIYTGDMGSHTVTQLDPRTGQAVRSFDVPRTPEAVGMPADGREVWAGSNAEGKVSVIDPATGQVRTAAEGFGWPYRIVFTPDGGTVVLPDMRNEEVRILDRASHRELARIPFAGGGPQGITITPDGRYAFLSLSARGQVAIIDLRSRTVVRTIDAGPAPDGIVYTARTF
jgi:DNA-binding beta-propeller fold protein YncE/imidazolonepropionase-like amidohydrolase